METNVEPSTAPPPNEYLKGYLTLAAIRSALWLDTDRVDPRAAQPFGLTGPHAICVSVLDMHIDYYLPHFTVTLTPQTTGWDIMRMIAWRWASYPVMDDFVLALIHPVPSEEEGGLCVALYCDEGVVLSEAEVDQLPW